jgi:hypothetical protein
LAICDPDDAELLDAELLDDELPGVEAPRLLEPTGWVDEEGSDMASSLCGG